MQGAIECRITISVVNSGATVSQLERRNLFRGIQLYVMQSAYVSMSWLWHQTSLSRPFSAKPVFSSVGIRANPAGRILLLPQQRIEQLRKPSSAALLQQVLFTTGLRNYEIPIRVSPYFIIYFCYFIIIIKNIYVSIAWCKDDVIRR